MKNANTLKKSGFIIGHFVWNILAWTLYENTFLQSLPSVILDKSRWILLLTVIISNILLILLQLSRHRNRINIFFDILFVYGFYNIPAYLQTCKVFTVICLAAAIVMSFIYAMIIMHKKVKVRLKKSIIIRMRMIQIAFISKNIMSCNIALIMLISLIINNLDHKQLKVYSPSVQYYTREQAIYDNIDKLLQMQNDEWEKLTSKERVDLLQNIADSEQTYLGLPDKLHVGVATLNEGSMGYYYKKEHKIIVSLDSLLYDPPKINMKIICHEAYHSYQHCLVDMLNDADDKKRHLRIFDLIAVYSEEFDNYLNGEDDYDGYYNQHCENDAREYADNAVNDYYRIIREYVNENK